MFCYLLWSSAFEAVSGLPGAESILRPADKANRGGQYSQNTEHQYGQLMYKIGQI